MKIDIRQKIKLKVLITKIDDTILINYSIERYFNQIIGIILKKKYVELNEISSNIII